MSCSIKCLFKDTAIQNDTVNVQYLRQARKKAHASGKRIQACKFWKNGLKENQDNTM